MQNKPSSYIDVTHCSLYKYFFVINVEYTNLHARYIHILFNSSFNCHIYIHIIVLFMLLSFTYYILPVLWQCVLSPLPHTPLINVFIFSPKCCTYLYLLFTSYIDVFFWIVIVKKLLFLNSGKLTDCLLIIIR